MKRVGMADQEGALTERELEIVRAVATGATNQQIARELSISINTVKAHLKSIFAKLDIQSRTEVALYAVREGLVEVEAPPATEVDTASRDRPVKRQPMPRRKRLILFLAMAASVLLLALPRVEMAPSAPAASEFEDVAFSGASRGPTVQPSRWNAMAPLPTPRSRLAAAYNDGRIYAIGGYSSDGVTGTVEVYDVALNSWRSLSPKPISVHNVGAAFVGGRIFVPGGYAADGQVIAELEIYDPERDMWDSGGQMPQPLCAYAIATLGKDLYLFGGWDGSGYVATTLMYDTGTDTWQQLTPMSSARGFSAAGVIDNRIYVVGGYDGKGEIATVEEYDPTKEGRGNAWRTRRPMSTARGGLGVATIAGSLYAIGGGWNGYLAFNERYDPLSNRWSPVETPVFGQWRNLAVVASDIRVYALGGWNGALMDVNQEYQALYTYYLPEVR